MSDAIESQGTVVQIGRGNAVTVLPGADTFDTIGEVKTWGGPSGSASVMDASHLGSTRREKRMGLPDEGQMTLGLNRIFTNIGQKSARAARSARQMRNFKITYSDGSVGSFTGFVLEFSSSGGVDAIVEGSITIEISGEYFEDDAS